MTGVSPQAFYCTMCGRETERTCMDGRFWERGVCSMRCFYEKDWRGVLSLLGKPYRPDERQYDDKGYPIPKGA